MSVKGHILAINNDPAVLGIFRDLLETAGYRGSLQRYAEKDPDEVADLAPDLIILDYMWDDEDGGWSFLQILRMDPRFAPNPIVLCTGAIHRINELGARLTEMGVKTILKPFNIDELLEAIALSLAVGKPE